MTRQTVLVNSAWLMADKVVRLGLGLVIWIWLARHFGPAGFGLWNYAMAFAALFGALAGLGLEGVLVRELVRHSDQTEALLGTAFVLRMSSGVLATAACLLTAFALRPSDELGLALVAMNAAVFMLQSFQVADQYFQSRMLTRPAVLAVNAAFLLASAGRLVLLAVEAPLWWFGASLVVEAALAAALLLVACRADGMSARRWRFRADLARNLLSESWPLLLSGLAVMAYMRLDQVMLAAMAGDTAVGQFSAALRISEVWYFIPAAIVTAAFPALMKTRAASLSAYEANVQMLYDAMAWLGLAVAVVVSLVAPWLVDLLYGAQYQQAAAVLTVQIWAGVAVSMSFVHGKWLLAEGLQRYGLIYTLAAAAINVGLNLLLIPDYGAVGAAWATLAAQTGPLLIQPLLPPARRNFVMMARTAWAPYRLWRGWRQHRP